MRAFLRENNSFVAVSPVPKEDVVDGLVLHLLKPNKGFRLPAVTGDIKAGVMRYEIPEGLRKNVFKVTLNDKGGA